MVPYRRDVVPYQRPNYRGIVGVAGSLYASRNQWYPYAKRAYDKLSYAAKRYGQYRRYKKRQEKKKVAGVKRKRPVSYKPPKKAKISTRVAKLEKHVAADTSLSILRKRTMGQIASSTYKCQHYFFAGSTKTTLESAISSIKYYDPSAPATLITADQDAGLYPQEIQVKNWTKYEFINNYLVPIKVAVYAVEVKMDTQTDPISALEAGLSDIPSSTVAYDRESPLLYPTDSKVLGDLFKLTKLKTKTLYPGQKITTQTAHGYVSVDPATLDVHTNVYQRSLKSNGVLIRFMGVMGRDTSQAEVGTVEAALDYVVYSVNTVKYDAGGAKLYDVRVDDNQDTFTNNGVVPQKTTQLSTGRYSAETPMAIVAPLGNQTQAASVAVRETTL